MKSFRDIVQEAEISYEDWKKTSAEINAEVDAADDEIKAIAGDTKGGLVPDEVLKSKEFTEYRKCPNLRYGKYRIYNILSIKKWKNLT